MRRLLISLTDFPDFVPFSINIGAHLVNPHIRAAQTTLLPLLSTAQWDALDAALQAIAPEFAPEEFYSEEFQTQATEAGWEDANLAALWYGCLRPLLVCESGREMLLWHGLHITPNAAEITTDRPISGAQRTELRGNLDGKANVWRAKFEPLYRAAFPSTTTPTTCSSARPRRNRGGLQTSAI